MDCATCSAQYSLYLQDLIRHFMALVRCHVHLLANRPSRSSTVRIKPNDTTSSTALTLRRELEAYTEPKQNKEKRAKTRKIRPEQPRPTEIIFKYHMYAYLFTKMYANGSIHICFLQNMYGHRYIDIFVYVCICLCIYAQLCTYLNGCVYAYMNMYICTCICIVFSRSSFGKDPICNLPERDVAPRCRVQKKYAVYM